MPDDATELVLFVEACLAQDEAAALGCPSHDWVASGATVRGGPRVRTAGPGPLMSQFVGEPFPDTVAVPLPREPRPDDFWTQVNLHGTTGKFESEMRVAEYIASWDPSRVLAEVEAKREVLRLHHRMNPGECVRCHEMIGPDLVSERYPCRTLRAVISLYAGSPGFRPEWAMA